MTLSVSFPRGLVCFCGKSPMPRPSMNLKFHLQFRQVFTVIEWLATHLSYDVHMFLASPNHRGWSFPDAASAFHEPSISCGCAIARTGSVDPAFSNARGRVGPGDRPPPHAS